MDLSNLQRLRVFLKVAERLSFTAAADDMCISQPAVSKRIRELEAIVGAPLFDRIGHTIALTEAGYSLLELGRKTADAVGEMESRMEVVTQRVGGQLRIAAVGGVWEYILPTTFRAFRKAHPGVRLALSVVSTRRVIDRVFRNDVHLGLVGSAPAIPGLESMPIAEDEFVIVSPINHELARGQRVRSRDVHVPLPFVHTLTSPVAASHSNYMERLGFPAVSVLELESAEAIKRAVRLGLGLAIMSWQSVAEELARGELGQVRLDGPPSKRTLHAIRNNARPISRAQSAFLACLVQTVTPAPITLSVP